MGRRPTQSTKVRHTPRRSVPRYVSPFVGARYPVQSGQVGARRTPISPVYGWVLSLVSEGGLKVRIFYFIFQRQLRPRRVDGGTQQVARCAAVHSAGSQLPLRVLGMYLCRAPETTRRR